MRNIAFQLVLQQCTLQNKLYDFVASFTSVLVSEIFFFQHATITTHDKHRDACGISTRIFDIDRVKI